MQKTIVLINGVARSGKDTFAEMIIPHLCENDKTGFILPNAFGVKEVASRVYGWDGEKDERGRGLLLDVTKTGYNYDPMFWEKYAHRHLKHMESTMKSSFDFVVVPDFRYPITQRYYIACGLKVITINIIRPNHDNDLGVHKTDVSEQDLGIDFDFVVINSDLEYLESQAKVIANILKNKVGK